MKKLILCFFLVIIASIGVYAQNISIGDSDSLAVKKQPNGKNRVSAIFYIPDVEDSIVANIQRQWYATRFNKLQALKEQLQLVEAQLRHDSTQASIQLAGVNVRDIIDGDYQTLAGNWNFTDGNEKIKIYIDSIGTVFNNKDKAIGIVDIASSNGKRIFLMIGNEKNSLSKIDDGSFVNEKRKLKLERQKNK